MLYDILIIDDDFSGEEVLDEMESIKSKSTPKQSAWEQTIMPFYFGLIRENLKVIWSTGELDDLKKLSKSQLSKVRYIICDLHLSGIDNSTANKNIISKIMGILEKLKDNLGDNISFLINSKYIKEHLKIEQELQKELNKVNVKKYSVSKFDSKNAITDVQKQELINNSLLSHIKEQILEKHIQVERCLNEKINVNDEKLKELISEELTFNSKHKIVKKIFDLNGHNTAIEGLNDTRNTIAHNGIDSLEDLKNILKKIKIKHKNKKIENDIKKIKNFLDLFNYLEKIDNLINEVTNAKKTIK